MSLDAGMLDSVTQEFLNVFKNDAHHISAIGMRLFQYLAIIQLSLSALWMSLAGESLHRLLTRLTQLMFSFGFFYACISLGKTWIPHIINGFIDVGQTAGVKSIDPSSVLDQGIALSGGVMNVFFDWGLIKHPFVALLAAVVCIAIIIIYGLLAAELTIVLVKTYALASLSGIFFAFGASDFTRCMSRHYIQAVIGLGLQLMTLYFLMGVGQHVGNQWARMTQQAATAHEILPMFVVLASVIVFYLIVKNIPAFIASLAGVGGLMHYGEAAVATAISSGIGAASIIQSATGSAGRGVQHISGANQAVSLAYRATHPTTHDSRMSTFLSHSAQASKQLASSALHALKPNQTHSHRSFSQKLNRNLKAAVNNKDNPHTKR